MKSSTFEPGLSEGWSKQLMFAELVNKYTFSTRFLKKDRILFQIPAFEDHKQGRDVFLAF